MPKKPWVVIPAYNEAKRLASVLKKVKKYSKHIVVVDDGSQDKTSAIAKKEKVEVLTHIVNLGKGAALKTGCKYAIAHGADAIITMDSDGQHDPAEIPNFLNALESCEIVYGYRKLSKTMPSLLKFGNWFISKGTKFLYGIELRDTQSGYRAFNTRIYPKIKWRAIDYSIESEMIANAARNKLPYKEIPIATIYTNKYKGTTVLDGMRIVWKMLWWRFRR